MALTEQLGIDTHAAYWDVGDVRLWRSTDPGVILYAPNALRLAADDRGRFRAAVTQGLRWADGGYTTVGGTASLGLFGFPSADAVQSMKREWARVVRNTGYSATTQPEFAPLPVREVRLTATVDPSAAVVSDPADGGDSRTLSFRLTAAGAGEWARAIRDKAPAGGRVRLAYSYPRLMPQATAAVTVRGVRLVTGMAARLRESADGRPAGTRAEIDVAWDALVRTGDIEVALGDPANPADVPADMLTRLAAEARERLFDALFVPLPAVATDGPPRFALRWRTPGEAVDCGVTVAVQSWTWLTAALECDLASLLHPLDDGYLLTTYESVSVPATVTVEPSAMVTSVSTAVLFEDGRAPDAAVFDAAGGTRQLTVATAHPDALRVTYRATVNFAPANWPLVEVSGPVPLEGGFRVVLRPDAWLRRHTIAMAVRRGDRILRPADADPNDFLAVTATYQSAQWPTPVRTAARITARNSVEFSYPVPPGQAAGRATVAALGTVGGRMVRTAPLDVQEGEGTVYLLVDEGNIQLVGRVAVAGESDRLADRLRAGNGKPVVTAGVPAAEDERDIDVETDVTLIPQPTDVSCWAAALSMVVSARDRASTDPRTVAARAGMDVDTGYGWPDIRRAVSAWGLTAEGPRSAAPDEWARLLRAWGPIWVVEVGAPYHAVVLAGIWGDGTADGTSVTVYNPWPPEVGAIETKSFREFDTEFGLGAGADAMMVHAG